MRWLSLKSVADMLEVSPKTVRRWITEGKFPEASTYLPGGQARWADATVQAWALSQNTPPPPTPVKGK